MQALVRVQARVRARRVRMSMEGQAVQNMINERRTKAQLHKEAEVPSHKFITQSLHTTFKMLLVFFAEIHLIKETFITWLRKITKKNVMETF